ncbi:MAG: hypothetical protein ACI8XM_002399 [Haloarculaceae archaeon]
MDILCRSNDSKILVIGINHLVVMYIGHDGMVGPRRVDRGCETVEREFVCSRPCQLLSIPNHASRYGRQYYPPGHDSFKIRVDKNTGTDWDSRPSHCEERLSSMTLAARRTICVYWCWTSSVVTRLTGPVTLIEARRWPGTSMGAATQPMPRMCSSVS